VKSLLLAALLPVLACAQSNAVALSGTAAAQSSAGPQVTPKVVPLSGTATASGGVKTK
jgi:hypothetical protein